MAASPKPQFLPALLAAAALVIASCHAARLPQATAGGGVAAAKSHRHDPSCLEITQSECLPTPCTNYCFSIGLNTTGWCTFKGLNVYCCCPVPLQGAAATAELPASLSPSGPQAGLV